MTTKIVYPEALHANGVELLQNGDYGQGLAELLRAQRFLPRDKELIANISQLRELRVDQLSSGEWWYGFTHILSYVSSNDILLVVSILSVMTGLLLWLRFFSVAMRPWLGRGLAMVWAVFLSLALPMLFFFSQVDYALIIGAKVPVYNGPDELLDVQHYVHDGFECRVLSSVDGWVYVRFPNGLTGWVQAEEVTRV